MLLVCVAGGLLVPLYFLGMADVSHFAWDFRAYYLAADAALHGDAFVGIDTGLPGVSYVYPPISVVLFMPQAATGSWEFAFALHTALNVAAALGLAYLIVRTIEARRGPLSTLNRLLIIGFCLCSAPSMAVLGLGQIDLLLAFAFGGVFVAVEQDRELTAGAVLALTALVKVFPVVLGIWLIWRRAWRAVGAAIATGVTGLIAGWLWFGFSAYDHYFAVLAGRSRIADFAGTVSPNFFAMSLYRPLSQVFSRLDPHLYAPLAVLLVLPVVLLVASQERGFADRLTTYLVAITATILVSPASNALYVVYVYFPLVSLLFLRDAGWRRSVLLGGLLAMAFPVQPHQLGTILGAVGVPTPLRRLLVDVVGSALSVASVPLIGLCLVLAWTTLQAVRPADPVSVDARPVRSD